jgi:O-antigen/teichoic acid export membrane protein
MLGNNACNYLFHALASRALGPADYGALVSLLALLGLLTIPSTTIQTVAAQYVAVTEAGGGHDRVAGLMRRLFGHMLLSGIVLAAVLAAVSPWLARFFHLDSTAPVIVVGLAGIAMLCVSLARGWLQGLQRFHALGANILTDGVFRLLLGAVVFASGWKVAGGLGASALGASAALVLAFFFLPALLKPTGALRESARPLYRDALPVGVYLTAFMALASVDVLWVKHFFPADQAGYYGAASMVGKAFLFVGIAMAQVLFPKASASHAQEESAHHLLGKSVGLTALVLGLGLALAWPLAPLVVRTLFGAAFVNPETLGLVRLFGFALSPLALAYIFLQYHLAIRHLRLLWLLCGDVALLTGVLWFFHPTPATVLWTAGSNHLLLLGVLWGLTPRHPAPPESKPR